MRPKFPFLFIISTCVISSCCTQKGIKDNSAIKTVSPCIDIVEKIVTTSPKFIEFTQGLTEYVTSNGGKGYNYYLNGSPVPDYGVEKSDMYDYKVTEEYENRSEVVARFSFDPRKEVLYEYNIIENKLTIIDFDKSLLSSLHGNCDILPYEGKAYYLSEGKLYIIDLATKEQEELNISDKPILNYKLSPNQRYLAFEKEILNNDCHIVSSLVFYDLLKGKVFQELGGKDGFSGLIERWESACAIYSLSNEKKGIRNCYKTSLVSGKTERISEEEYNLSNEESEYQIVNPYDEGLIVKGDDEKLTLLHAQLNKETEIPGVDSRKLKCQTVQWLDRSRFVYAAEYTHETQCAPLDLDIYMYDLKTDSSTLIVKSAVCFDLQSDISISSNDAESVID